VSPPHHPFIGLRLTYSTDCPYHGHQAYSADGYIHVGPIDTRC